MIDSVYRRDKNYYPQVFLEECKYIVKEKKISNYITRHINISSDGSDREDSDYSDEENFNKKVRCVCKYKKLFPFIRKSLFQEIMINLIIFALEYKRFTKQTKSAVISVMIKFSFY